MSLFQVNLILLSSLFDLSFNFPKIGECFALDEILMQLGKVESGFYNCDFSYPFCALQAFGFALSSLCR